MKLLLKHSTLTIIDLIQLLSPVLLQKSNDRGDKLRSQDTALSAGNIEQSLPCLHLHQGPDTHLVLGIVLGSELLLLVLNTGCPAHHILQAVSWGQVVGPDLLVGDVIHVMKPDKVSAAHPPSKQNSTGIKLRCHKNLRQLSVGTDSSPFSNSDNICSRKRSLALLVLLGEISKYLLK